MRPKKTLDDLPSGWREAMLNLAKDGASDVELRVELGCISDDLWYRLIAEEPEFSRTVKECKLLCQCWWERFGRTHLIAEKGESVNANIYTFNMSNRFGWASKQDVKEESKQSIEYQRKIVD